MASVSDQCTGVLSSTSNTKLISLRAVADSLLGGGTTDVVQVNDTNLHARLQATMKDLEAMSHRE